MEIQRRCLIARCGLFVLVVCALPSCKSDSESAATPLEGGQSNSDLDQSIADSTEAIRLKPDLAEPYINRGIFYTDKGEYDKAFSDFAEALRINPRNSAAYCNRGRGLVYERLDYQTKAEKDFAEARRLGYTPISKR